MPTERERNEYIALFDHKWATWRYIVGFCGNATHRGWVDTRLLSEHRCVEKQCIYLEKSNPGYWGDDYSGTGNSNFKNMSNAEKRKHARERDDYIKSVLRPYTDIYVTSVRADKKGLIVTYIYDKRVDLKEAIYVLRDKFKCKILLRAVKSSDETRAKLIRSRGSTDLLSIPGVGIVTKQRLKRVGYHFVEDLVGADADDIYEKECILLGRAPDRRTYFRYKIAIEYSKRHKG